MSWGLQASLFPIKIPSKFQAFFNTPSWTSFFRLLMLPGAKMLDFWTPLAPSGIQNGAQNRKSGAQEALYAPVRAPPGRVLERTFLQDPFLNVILSILTLLGTTLVDFGWIFYGFGMDFGIISKGFWTGFCSSICRMPTPPGTKRNNGKRQEHADNCRNMQKSNATKNA